MPTIAIALAKLNGESYLPAQAVIGRIRKAGRSSGRHRAFSAVATRPWLCGEP
jgi:hypothetical protein